MHQVVHREEIDLREVPEHRCVVCASATDEVGGCCSQRCAQEAERQIRRNAALLRRAAAHDAPTETRRRLAERNGRLSSALLRWRPAAVGELLD